MSISTGVCWKESNNFSLFSMINFINNYLFPNGVSILGIILYLFNFIIFFLFDLMQNCQRIVLSMFTLSSSLYDCFCFLFDSLLLFMNIWHSTF
jgi:hypothetical protein